MSPNQVLLGTVVPILGYFALKRIVIDPYLRREELREKVRQLSNFIILDYSFRISQPLVGSYTNPTPAVRKFLLCALDTDWCLQSDVMTNSRWCLQAEMRRRIRGVFLTRA